MLRNLSHRLTYANATTARALGFLLAASIVLGLLLTAAPAHAADFTVNTAGDQADRAPGNGECFTGRQPLRSVRECTLRAAIEEANANDNSPTIDQIKFNIRTFVGGPVHKITPFLRLPAITERVTIDGYSQPGTRPNTASTGTNAVLAIELDGSHSEDGASGLVVRAPHTTVRGLAIHSFLIGVFFEWATPSGAGNKLEGSFVGTDAGGTQDLGNLFGVSIQHGEGHVIGGATLAARNLISGNSGDGVSVGDETADGNSVQGNLIGTDKTGNSSLGNGTGVSVASVSDNTIGGPGAAHNTIAFNGGSGVEVREAELGDPPVLRLARGNRILSNRIHNNGGLGIDLGGDGVTQNDGDNPATPEPDPDADAGPNRQQNFPTLSSAQRLGSGTTISGKLSSRPGTNFTIQFFSNPAGEVDSSGFGEGKRFLGEIQLTTNATGQRAFSFASAAVPAGDFVTATATRDGTGDTSEFSRAVRVQEPVIGG